MFKDEENTDGIGHPKMTGQECKDHSSSACLDGVTDITRVQVPNTYGVDTDNEEIPKKSKSAKRPAKKNEDDKKKHKKQHKA